MDCTACAAIVCVFSPGHDNNSTDKIVEDVQATIQKWTKICENWDGYFVSEVVL